MSFWPFTSFVPRKLRAESQTLATPSKVRPGLIISFWPFTSFVPRKLRAESQTLATGSRVWWGRVYEMID
jgi:hypothetical protein